MIRPAIGQDSHRFDASGSGKPLVLAGVVFDGEDALEANSDGDVILHAVTRAITGITTGTGGSGQIVASDLINIEYRNWTKK